MSEDTSLTVSSHSTTDDTQARHKALVEALQGESPMTWDDWASPIYDSQYLTSSGQRVALWAVDILKRTLGSDFLERAIAKPPPRPIFCPTLWPGANDVPWVYANLFQLAAQIELHVRAHSKYWGKVQRVMRDYIMETFPIVKRKDEKQYGEYRTERVILEIYDEMKQAMETGKPYKIRLESPSC